MSKDYHYDKIDYTIDPNRKYYVNENRFLYNIQIKDKTFTHIGGKKGLDKIIQIRDHREMIDFFKEYMHPKTTEMRQKIDWTKVYMEYGGIELAVTHHEKYLDMTGSSGGVVGMLLLVVYGTAML